MKTAKAKQLKNAGWKVGSANEFLGLSESETMIVNMRVALARKVKAIRKRKRLSQDRLAKIVGSSQSRIAKMENADSSVSIELLIKTLASLGASQAQIGRVVGTSGTPESKKLVKS